VKDSRDDAASASGASGPGESAVGMKTEKKVQEQRLLRFYGNPWAARGEDGVACVCLLISFFICGVLMRLCHPSAKRIICRLFTSLAEQGFSYLSTLHGASPTPTPSHPSHLIFTSAQPDPEPSFFAMSFSHSHKHLTLVDAPKDVVGAVVNGIRNHVKGSAEGCWYTEGAYKLELPGAVRSSMSLLHLL
jgi:hypothetical protein